MSVSLPEGVAERTIFDRSRPAVTSHSSSALLVRIATHLPSGDVSASVMRVCRRMVVLRNRSVGTSPTRSSVASVPFSRLRGKRNTSDGCPFVTRYSCPPATNVASDS